MQTLKQICRTLLRLVKQVPLLPQTMATAAAERRKRFAADEREAERLDRICNPSKYRGR